MSNGTFEIELEVDQYLDAEIDMESLMIEFPGGLATDEELIKYLHADIDGNDDLKAKIDPPRPCNGQQKAFLKAAREYMQANIEEGGVNNG